MSIYLSDEHTIISTGTPTGNEVLSPHEHCLITTWGHAAKKFSITVDGPGDIELYIRVDSNSYGDVITLKSGETYTTDLRVDKFKIVHAGTDSSVRYYAEG